MTAAELAAARQSMGMSRRQLAEATGKSFDSIKHFELGDRPISATFALLVERLVKEHATKAGEQDE